MIDGLRPYPEMKPTGLPWLGDVPAHWDVRRIKTLLREVDNRSVSGEERLLSLRMRQGLVDHLDSGGKPIPPDALVGFRIVEPDQIVMNKMRAAYGLFGVANVRGLVSPDYAVFKPMAAAYNRYLVEVFRMPSLARVFRAESKGLGNGESGFLRLYTDRFGAISISCPPLDEQRLIVRFLDWHGVQTAKLIRTKRKLIALLNEQKQAIIHRAVTRGLDPNLKLKPSGVPWIGDVPNGWDVWQIGHLARIGNGSTPSRSNPAFWNGGTYPWLNSSAANESPVHEADQYVTDLALRECHLPKVPAGSVIMAITGQGKTRGRAAILPFEATINQHLVYIDTKNRNLLSPEYLQLLLVAAYNELRRFSDESGSTRGALTCGDIRHFKIPLPDPQQQNGLQEAIANMTAEIDRSISAAQREIVLIDEFRSRLIADVVTGNLDVRAAAAALPELIEIEPIDDPIDDEGLDEVTESPEIEEVAA